MIRKFFTAVTIWLMESQSLLLCWTEFLIRQLWELEVFRVAEINISFKLNLGLSFEYDLSQYHSFQEACNPAVRVLT
jgi:hypothetical protein